MKKLLFNLAFTSLISYSNAQVGVGTSSPAAALDVAKSVINVNTTADGIRYPNMTKQNLADKTSTTYGAPQIGTIVYVTTIGSVTSGTSLTQVANVDLPGYYFFDGSLWQKLPSTGGGDSTNDAWVNNTSGGRVELGTLSNGKTIRDSGNEMVATDTGNFGIGTISPTTKLHVISGGTSVNPISAVTINDGTQGINRVLTSDINGVAKWTDLKVEKVRGVMRPANSAIPLLAGGNGGTTTNGTITLTTSGASADKIHLGSYIDLPPGKWEVEANILVNLGLPGSVSGLNYIFNKFTFTEETTATVVNQSGDLPPTSQSGWLIGGSTTIFGSASGSTDYFYTVINGKVFITNGSATTKRYYLVLWQGSRKFSNYQTTTVNAGIQIASETISMTNLGSNTNGENYISAQRIN